LRFFVFIRAPNYQFRNAPSSAANIRGLKLAVKMPRRPQKTGGLLQKRRGQMTHAGLAMMAVAARLGPA
jgi:hypothetical protein